MVPYAQHVIIPTGRHDWKSKIEDEKHTAPWGIFAADLKSLLGRRGEYHDVCLCSLLLYRKNIRIKFETLVGFRATTNG